MQDVNLYDLHVDSTAIVFYLVRANEVYADDNLMLGSQGTTNKYTFYSIDRGFNAPGNFKRENQSYFRLFISIDQQTDQYFRSTNNEYF